VIHKQELTTAEDAQRCRRDLPNPNYLAAVPRALIRPATTSNAEPMIDDRLSRGVDASWTSDGRGGGRRGSNPQLQPWEGAVPFLNSRVTVSHL